VIRAQVAFQSLYDYLDTLTELPHADPVRNSRRLHGALTAALDPGAQASAYYAHHPVSEDGGYLQGTVERCQSALSVLPGYAAVQLSVTRLGGHIVEFQSHNLPGIPNPSLAGGGDEQAPREALARWAGERTPSGSGLRWWETAASAGSSLGVFALFAMAIEPGATAAEARAVEDAYFPWIGGLHSLLDSLIDLPEDRASGQPALIEHYGSEREAAVRLGLLAEESRRRAAALPHADRHLAILASMASLYLSEREALRPEARQVRAGVLGALGGLTGPAMLAARARRLTL
jgi:tetraprenyl-beta-curcumene synthase